MTEEQLTLPLDPPSTPLKVPLIEIAKAKYSTTWLGIEDTGAIQMLAVDHGPLIHECLGEDRTSRTGRPMRGLTAFMRSRRVNAFTYRTS